MQIFSSLTDEQLVKSYVEGNNEAFDALLLRHQSKLFSYIMRIVRNRDIADDIFQETFVKAIMTIKQKTESFRHGFIVSPTILSLTTIARSV